MNTRYESAKEIYANPAHPYTKALFSAIPPVSPYEKKKRSQIINIDRYLKKVSVFYNLNILHKILMENLERNRINERVIKKRRNEMMKQLNCDRINENIWSRG